MLRPIVKRCCGLDVHKAIIVATALIEQASGEIEEIVREFNTFPEDLERLAAWLLELSVEMTVMESTGVFWKSVYRVLEKSGITAAVVNARHIKQVPGRKTDVSDSKWIASIARCGLFRASFIPDQDLHGLRLMTRYYVKLTGTKASQTNRMHKILDDAGLRLGIIFSDLNGVSACSVIEKLIEGGSIDEIVASLHRQSKHKAKDLRSMLKQDLSEAHKFVLKEILDNIKHLETKCGEVETKILSVMAQDQYKKQWQMLQTIPGINALSAALIIAEIGTDMKRFGGHERFCSWAGMCPGNNESAGKRKSGRANKGSPVLRTTLVEAANAAIKTKKSQFAGHYRSLIVRAGHKKAIFAVGHKMLRVIHSVLLNLKAYVDPCINYEELVVKRNAPRWIKRLLNFGYAVLTANGTVSLQSQSVQPVQTAVPT